MSENVPQIYKNISVNTYFVTTFAETITENALLQF